jgi:hypothetical protein
MWKKPGEFFVAAGRLGGGSVVFALCLFVVSIYEHIADHDIPAYWLEGLGLLALCFGAFIAWSQENRRYLTAARELTEVRAGPRFDGCVFRTCVSQCNGVPNMSIQQYSDLMKMQGRDDACDCDFLIEIMIENLSPGLASILTAEARIDHEGQRFSAFADADLSRYTLSMLDASSPLSRLIDGETKPLQNLFETMTANAPLQKGYKIEGWLRFKFENIHPIVFDKPGRLEIVLHDSRLSEHAISKMLSLRRTGHVIIPGSRNV